MVAVIDDDGVWHDHNDLYPRVIGDNEWAGVHGTAVAGILGAKGNNAIATAGICWNCQIYAGNIEGFDIPDICNTIISAVDSGSNIINNSWGSSSYVIALRRALAYAYKMNVLTVCSKGNGSSSEPNYPSDFGQGIISVGAYGNWGHWMDYSNTGNGIDIVAPGDGILTTGTDNANDSFVGSMTSFAAPHASGVAALLKGYNNNLCNDDIENIINITAKDNIFKPATEGYDEFTGWGNLNAKAAFDILQKPNTITRIEEQGGVEYSHNGPITMTFFDIPGLADGFYMVFRYDVRKPISFPASYLEMPHVWGRGVGSVGYSPDDVNYGMGYTNVIDGSITKTGCSLQTFVYHVFNLKGDDCGWFPCEVSGAKFAYSSLGEFELSSAPYISCTNHYDHQSIKVCFEDPNPNETGWIIERKDATSLIWELIDTLPSNDDQYFHYEDYYPVGSETYTYRVKPFTSNQQNAPYSNEVTVTARPRWPDNLTAYATDCTDSLPVNTGCNAPIPKLVPAKAAADAPPADPLENPIECHSQLGNDITVRWSHPSNQKYPIVKYIVKRCNTLGIPEETWTLNGDTCMYICPVDAQSSYKMNVYSIASNGDTSLPAIDGVCTGSINICPGNIPRYADEEYAIIPDKTELHQNYPNPFNMSTEISFSLARSGQVTIDIYDLLGRKIVGLIDREFEPGRYKFTWNGRDTDGNEVSSGIYFYRIKAGEYIETRKMMMLK